MYTCIYIKIATFFFNEFRNKLKVAKRLSSIPEQTNRLQQVLYPLCKRVHRNYKIINKNIKIYFLVTSCAYFFLVVHSR